MFRFQFFNNDIIDDSYCKTLNYKDDNYIDNVLFVIDTLTKSFTNEQEEN